MAVFPHKYAAFLQYMGIHMSSNAKWSLTDSLEKESWEFAATRETLSEQDMLCTPWLTINICFVFLMPTRGTCSPEKDGTGWNAMPAGYFLFFFKMLFLICLRLHKQQLHGRVRHRCFSGKVLYHLYYYQIQQWQLNICIWVISVTHARMQKDQTYVRFIPHTSCSH